MQQNRGSQNQRLVKTLLILISFLALLSWIPLIIMNTLFVCNCSINWSVYNWASFLNFSNSLVNPLVYALRIPEPVQKGIRLNVLLHITAGDKECGGKRKKRKRVY